MINLEPPDMKRLLFSLAFILCLVPFWAQSRAFIVFAEGEGFRINRAGQEKEYSIVNDNVFSVDLAEGDILLTDSKTFLEIQLVPSLTLIKIAENTTIRIGSVSGAAGGNWELLYGKVKAKVDKTKGSNSFAMFSNTTVASVKGTDFGFDVTLNLETGATDSSVYSFEGNVDISMNVPSSQLAKTEKIILKTGEMVVRSTNAPVDPKSVKPVSDKVSEYWSRNDFKTQAKPADFFPGFETIADTVAPPKEKGKADYLPGTLLATSGLLALGGTVFYQGFQFDPSRNDGSMPLYALGGALFLAGLGNLFDQAGK
jgi:hypothetical protein